MSGLSTLSKQIAKHGRYGDDEILHVNKAEIAGLDNLARQIYGHPLTRNPATGQKEAFLFLPFLAPMLASAGVLGAGMTGLGALGTGLLAGGAGALEASARGMDDPLKQGLMAGLTAGAGSALTSGIMGAAGQPGIDATANSMASSMGGGAQTADMLAQNMAAGASPSYAAHSLAGGTLQQAAAPSALDLAGTSTSRFGTGLKNLATDDKALGTFLSAPATKGAAIAGATGLAGMSQLDYEAKTKAENDAREAEKQQKYDALKNQIKQRYADAGRTGWWDQPGALNPNFAAGGRVQNEYTAARDGMADNYSAAGREIPSWLQGYGADMRAQLDGEFGFGGGLLGLDGALISALVQNLRAQGADIPEGKSIFGRAMQQRQYAAGGRVFPMETGGFVVPKYAVDAAGGGDNDRGLVALKRHAGAKAIRGKGTGTSDSIPAKIDGKIPAKVSNGEAYIPPKGVKKAGGSKQLYKMMAAAKNSRKG